MILLRIIKIYNPYKIGDYFHFSKESFKMKDIKDLSLQEKIGQLFIISVKGFKLTDKDKIMIREHKIGNFIIFSKNYQNINQLSKLINNIYKEVISSIGIIPLYQ